jgi:peptidoglycan/xylan/chitin deacetylase (PgdA/CDA1 family)
MMRLVIVFMPLLLCLAAQVRALEPVPDKTVVLTFDDSVKSHRTFVAPMLQELGFGATFFITGLWMNDAENFISWAEVGELHTMGFEIGNHSWSHASFGNPAQAARLAGQLALVEAELENVGVPKPVSFAWCGNTFSPEGVAVLQRCGYQFARRGMQPEVAYGQSRPGPLYDAARAHPLLIPSAGDAYPDWTLDDFRRAVDRAKDGQIAVVQFHGVPDVAHPWVNTPPERFAEYMRYLKDNGFNVIGMRDLARYADPLTAPEDAMAQVHYAGAPLDTPQEVAATRANPGFWLDAMLRQHQYTIDEAAAVFGWPVKTLEARLPGLEGKGNDLPQGQPRVLPYPGGRHPRIGFLDGAVDPLRGTKVSVFAPWGEHDYAVIDLPEAIFSNLGLLFLSHTHVPTIWDLQHVAIENRDWEVLPNGTLQNIWTLPNGVRFGASVVPEANGAALELWLENGTPEPLTGLRTQICVMLKGMPGFDAQTNDHKEFLPDSAVAQSPESPRKVVVEFEHCARAWGNPLCPCIHADPVLPDCAPGARVSVKGSLRFEGE